MSIEYATEKLRDGYAAQPPLDSGEEAHFEPAIDKEIFEDDESGFCLNCRCSRSTHRLNPNGTRLLCRIGA